MCLLEQLTILRSIEIAFLPTAVIMSHLESS